MADLAVRVGEHVEETAEEVGEPGEHVGVGDGVQDDYPAHQELADVRVGPADVLLEEGDEGVDFEGVGLDDDVLDEPVEEVGTVLDVNVNVREEGAEPVEDGIEVLEYPRPRNLRNIVKALTRVVPDSRLRVVEAPENRREEGVEVSAGV